MSGVFKREITAYFRNMAGYVYLAVFFVVCGYFFVLNNLLGGSGNISGVYSGIYLGMAMLIPLLTMDSLLAQAGYGVEYTLYTSPVQMVLGKFLAALTLTAVGILGTTVYAGILAVFCRQDMAGVFFGQLGLLLLAADYIAIGLFASAISLRRTQAAITSYTLLLMFYMLNRSFQSLPGIAQVKTVWMASFFSAYGNFELGIMSPTGILSMLIFTMIVLAVTAAMINRRKERGI